MNRHNGSHDTFIGICIVASGARHVFRWCKTCPPSPYRDSPPYRKLEAIPQRELRVPVESLPVVHTRERPDSNYPPCEVKGCDQPGKDRHHWAPKALFGGAADDWPTSHLCKPHHREWHSTFVNLGLMYPSQSDRTENCDRCGDTGTLNLWWKSNDYGYQIYERCGDCDGRGWQYTPETTEWIAEQRRYWAKRRSA